MRRNSVPTPPASRGKGSFRFLLTVAAALALAACSPAASTPTSAPTPASTVLPTLAPSPAPTITLPAPTPTATPTTLPTTAATPTTSAITITDDEGTTITLPGPPQKVISLTPATSELMFALGAGDRLVGRTNYDDYPPQISSVPAVATFQGVEMEKVVNIGPDLVLAGGNGFTSAADIKRMRDLGYPVLVLYAKDVPGVLADIRLVGQAVGEASAADSIATSIQSQIDQVTQAVAGLPAPRTFYEIGDDPELYGPAPDSFVADMVTLAGGDALTTTDPSVFSIPVERLVALDPQVIILGDAAYGTCPDTVAARPGWESITAVKNGDIRPVDDTIVTRPGPRVGDGLIALALAIHPDAALTAPPDAVAYCTASPSPSP
ncbi:MAG TPA: helical backbone metal receptor [Candidatus Limnocylindrales bacterium]